MNRYINKEIANQSSPTPNSKWLELNENDRKKLIETELKKDIFSQDFRVNSADNNAQIVLEIEKTISADKRGLSLLELEQKLKKNVDQAITIWLEPVGDKSKLRKLRGIEIKT